MNIIQRSQREPAKFLAFAFAFATAVLAVLAGTDVLTAEGATIALGVVAAAIGLLSYVVTPSAEVAAQDVPGKPGLVAGRAARAETGTLVKVEAIE